MREVAGVVKELGEDDGQVVAVAGEDFQCAVFDIGVAEEVVALRWQVAGGFEARGEHLFEDGDARFRPEVAAHEEGGVGAGGQHGGGEDL